MRLEELLVQDLLQAIAVILEKVTKETLTSARQFIQTMCCMVHVKKRRYVERQRDIACNLQTVRQGGTARTQRMANREANVCELELEVQLLAEKTERVMNL